MFRVKICGVTHPLDAMLVVEAGADAVGLNFVAGSPRCLAPDTAARVAEMLPPRVTRVGVFAGMAVAEIRTIAETVGLDAIQLHGHLDAPAPGAAPHPWEPPDVCAALAPWPVIRAARLDAAGPADAALDTARRWIAAAAAAGRAPSLLLVDATPPPEQAAALGGTGRAVDWRRLRGATPPGIPIVLAGGLTPGNVAEAIRATGVTAVDTASGVESSPGRKDRDLVAAFVRAARAAIEGENVVRPPLENPFRFPAHG